MTAQRPAALRVTLGVLGVLIFAGLTALGTWQVRRLYWKLDLIERVDQRVHADPVPTPGPARWAGVTAQSDEYRHVTVSGIFLPQSTTLVQAVTDLGAGYWMLTALRSVDGSTVLVNRGYVAPAAAASAAANPPATGAAGRKPDAALDTVTVTGLLRMSEPGGGFLRKNDPGANRWYSRDVQAIGAARGLSGVAPYFIDQDAAMNRPGRYPIGGLTVISFPNNHLVYALTWYALAIMVAAGGWWAVRQERRPRELSTDLQ